MLLSSLCLVEEGDVVGRCFRMYVLQSDIHRTNCNAEFLEAREKVEEMMRRQRQFGRLDRS